MTLMYSSCSSVSSSASAIGSPSMSSSLSSDTVGTTNSISISIGVYKIASTYPIIAVGSLSISSMSKQQLPPI